MDEKMLWGIRLARALSASAEVTAAILLLRMTDLNAIIRLNGLLGLVGPMAFITVMALGLAGSVGKLQPGKLMLVLFGVICIVLGTRR